MSRLPAPVAQSETSPPSSSPSCPAERLPHDGTRHDGVPHDGTGHDGGGRAVLEAAFTVSHAEFSLGVDFDMHAGEVVAVLGPNGAGKTTLLRALAGLAPVDDGTIHLAGRSVDGAGVFVPAEQRSVGMVFQDYRLFPHLSVRENVAFGPRSLGVKKAQARERALRWLTTFGIDSLAGRKPAQLSGGQAQRVALCRALATDPDLLLLDEPLSALDAQTRSEVRRELGGYLRRLPVTSLVVTHDPLDAMVLADRMIILERGRIVQQGSAAAIAERPANSYVARLVGVNLYDGVALADGRLDTPTPSSDELGLIRPDRLTVDDDPPPYPGSVAARGVVTSMEFHTDQVRLWIEHGRMTSMVDVSPVALNRRRWAEGACVWVSAAPDDVVTYPAP